MPSSGACASRWGRGAWPRAPPGAAGPSGEGGSSPPGSGMLAVHVHVIGDAAVTQALDAFGEVCGAPSLPPAPATPTASASATACAPSPTPDGGPPPPVHLLLAHCQMVAEADVPRIVRLGAIPIFQPLWFEEDEETQQLLLTKLGAEHCARQYPLRAVLRAWDAAAPSPGAAPAPVRGCDALPFCCGSDYPVTAFPPLQGLRALRDAAPEVPPGRAYTLGAAHANGFGAVSGSLDVGKRTDFVQLLLPDPAALP